MENGRKNCVFCPRTNLTRKQVIELWDGSFACHACKKRSREESKAEYLERKRLKALENRLLDDRKKAKLFCPCVCRLCGRTVVNRGSWIASAEICRSCHRAMKNYVSEATRFFVDSRGRVFHTLKTAGVMQAVYGTVDTPKDALKPIRTEDGVPMFQRQQARMWSVVEANLSLVAKVARRLNLTDPELMDAGHLALMRAAVLYNSSSKASFETYARRAIYLALVRDYKKRSKTLCPSLDFDALAGSRISDQETIDQLHSFGLSVSDIELLDQRLVRGYTLQELADQNGMSKTNMRVRIQRLLNKCRSYKEDDE